MYGEENLPKDGGVLFSPNHQGAFLDPLLIGSMTPNRMTSLTRSDVFGGPLQWVLDAFQMLPVYRIRNGYSNLKKNDLTFAKCYKILGEGKFLLMFSEGGHHNEYYLQNLSKGSSRLAYQAFKENPNKKIYLQPMGINYGHHQQPRCTLHLVYGKPIEVNSFVSSQLTEAENINKLKEELQIRMKDCLWLAEKTEDYPERKKRINRLTTQIGFHELKTALKNSYQSLPVAKAPSKQMRFLAFLLSLPNIIPLIISRKNYCSVQGYCLCKFHEIRSRRFLLSYMVVSEFYSYCLWLWKPNNGGLSTSLHSFNILKTTYFIIIKYNLIDFTYGQAFIVFLFT